MAQGKWRWDQGTGELSYLEGNTPIRNTTLAELTNEFEATSGSAIYRPGTAAYTFFQGRSGLGEPLNPEPLVELFDNGQVIVTTGLARAPASLQTSEDSQYGIHGTVTMAGLSGQTRDLTIDFSTILGRNNHGYAYVDAHGVQRVGQFRIGSTQEKEFLRLYGGTARLASPQELMETALAGFIQKNGMDIVDEFAGVSREDPDAVKRAKRSGEIQRLARLYSSQIGYAKQHFVYQQDSE